MNPALAQLGALPSPSGIALKLMELAARDGISVGEVARLAAHDPALAGRLLKAANAPCAFPRRAAASVQEAIMRLGLPATRRLALAFSLVAEHRDGVCAGFDYARFWTGSLLRGVAAQALAARLRIGAADEAFCCGLLGRVGELALASSQPQRYAEVLEASPAHGPARRREERARLGVDHAELTLLLLEDWGFPEALLRAVRACADLDEDKAGEAVRPGTLVGVLRLAELVARAGLAEGLEKEERSREALFAGAQLGLDAEELLEIAVSVGREAAEWAPLFSLQRPPGNLIEFARERAAPEAPEESAPEGLQVLVVDDDQAMLILLRNLLEKAGHRVTLAHNGRDALAVAARGGIQLVVTDWLMPEMDGLELCRALRASPFGRRLHVLLLTSFEGQDRMVEGLEAGADDYVVKPFAPRVLLARVEAGCRALRMQEQVEGGARALRRFANELALNNRRLANVAMTDELTGLPNRRHALDRIAQECAVARRHGTELALIALDIDRFKAFNAAKGRDRGDAVLRSLAAALRGAIRLGDLACRTGGAEFAVLCPNTGARGARAVAEHLRAALSSDAALREQSDGLPVTVSVGFACARGAEADAAALLRAAEAALGEAKREDRERRGTATA